MQDDHLPQARSKPWLDAELELDLAVVRPDAQSPRTPGGARSARADLASAVVLTAVVAGGGGDAAQ